MLFDAEKAEISLTCRNTWINHKVVFRQSSGLIDGYKTCGLCICNQTLTWFP